MAPTNTSLKGKVAVITGASSGIGAEIARELSEWGASVLLVGRDEERLDGVASELSRAGAEADRLSIDITADEAPDEIVAKAVARFGTLDILVHAAGVFLPTPFVETPDSELDAQLAVNVRAPFRLTRSAAPHLSDGSAVIFVSSICGYVGCATKGAVELLVKSLSAEFAPKGIRVNAVAPGNVRTSINAHLLADKEYERQMLDSTPAGRVGEVGDIAPAVAFLASPAASYIHGSSLLIDGGWVAS